MKNPKIIFVIIILIISFKYTYSRQDSVTKIVFRKDVLSIGNYYRIEIKPNNILDGKLLSIKESNFNIQSVKEIINIDTSDIANVINLSALTLENNKRNTLPENRRAFFYLGFGFTNKSPAGSSHKYSNGYNANAKILYTFNTKFGLRADIDYYYFKREESTYTTSDFAGVHRTYKYYSGEASAYLFKTCLIYGNLNPEETVGYYFYPAIGIGTADISSKFDSYISGSIVPSYPTSDEKHSEFCIGVTFGTGINLKLSKSLRGFADVQYNAWHMGSKGPPSFFAANFGIIL